ncbi:MAG: hypothetical protein CR986_01625 [Ignavibacteriae bacterium]|nr:MAG: hypothetical protein CR986_01625 [Ignavibacteriota bacterium]
MNGNFEVIKKILNTNDAEQITTTVENFQLIEMPDQVVEYVAEKLLTDDNGVKDTITRILIKNKNKNIPKYIVKYISSENIAARNLAGEILICRGVQSIDAMLNNLPNANDDDQKFIIDILGLIGDPKPAQEIINVLKYTRDENVILACVEAMGNIKSDFGLDQLIKVYEQNELFRPTVIEAFGKIGTPACVDFINQNYYGVDELTKYSLIESLGIIGNENSFNMLIDDLKHLDNAYKWVAIETIGKLKEKLSLELPVDAGLKNALLETLETADNEYKKSAVKLVILFDDEELFEKVLTVYGNDDEIDNKLKEYFASNLVTFLKKCSKYLINEPKNIKETLNLLKEMIQIDGGISLQALDQMELRAFVEQFTVQLNNPDEEVRAMAMELLFFLDIETAIMFSDVMLEDTVSWNRLRLLDIIQFSDQPEIVEIIKKLTEDDDELVKENAQSILNERGISNLELKDNKC